jgi:hypothetical protein
MRTPASDRIDLDDGDYLIPEGSLPCPVHGRCKRADDDGLPFTLIYGLKYGPVRRGQESLRSRIKTLGQAKLSRRR